MLISEMIERLEEYKDMYGDIDIKSWNRDTEDDSSVEAMGVISLNECEFIRLITVDD